MCSHPRSPFVLATVLLAACVQTTPASPPAGRSLLPLEVVAPSDQGLPPDVVRAPPPPDATAGISLSLRLEDPAGLAALLAAQHDPSSADYRRWLTPSEFGDRFGVPATPYAGWVRQLSSAGFDVTTFPNRLFLRASGSVAQVERFLGVRLVAVSAGGQRWRSYQGEPTLPTELAARVQAVYGLDTRPWIRHWLAGRPAPGFGPQDLRRYYDVAPLHAQGLVGRGSSVVAVGTIPPSSGMPNPADIAYFYSNVSDSTARWSLDVTSNPNNEFDPEPGIRQEEELDSEMSTVGAPEEDSVTLVLAPLSELFGTGFQYVANTYPTATSVSVSFGVCEAVAPQALPTGQIQASADATAQGAAEGQAWFIASGDNGVTTCGNNPGAPMGASADFPADLPSVVGVGGTETTQAFDVNSAIPSWQSETTWNDGANGGAGGGGVSTLFAKPAWQVGPGTSSGSMREEPDMAMMAGLPGVMDDDTSPGRLTPVLGTSVAAPLTAGMFATLNGAIGGCRFGNPNPELYLLGARQADGGAAVFHDIITGNISFNGVTGPSAGPGYDEATGWGSLDVAQLAAAWPPCSTQSADSGYADAGPFDAGPLVPYDACGLLACDGGSVCFTTPEGPSACETACDGGVPCAAGEICGSVPGFGPACVPGCVVNSDCGVDSGFVCSQCHKTCLPGGNLAAHDGDGCLSDGDCPTGGTCLTDLEGFPGGYCLESCNPGVPACQCGPSAICEGRICFPTCSISANTGCRSGYVCNDPTDPSLPPDQGICFLGCSGQPTLCPMVNPATVCDSATGQCLGPNHSPDAGPPPDAGTPDAGSPHTIPPVPVALGPKTGCGCATALDPAAWALALLAITSRVCRRRARPSRP